MKEQRQVQVLRGSELTEYTIEFATTEPWTLKLVSNHNKNIEFSCEGTDVFECLCKMRKEYLEKSDCLIICNGSRIDVYPSRMSRQMSGGRKAYVMRLGEPAKPSDIVDIFDIPDNIKGITTVSKQKEYYDMWIKSLRQR